MAFWFCHILVAIPKLRSHFPYARWIFFRFQSSPSPKTGRYVISLLDTRLHGVFQSSPSPKTGRYYSTDGFIRKFTAVPILTQSENWALFYICHRDATNLVVPILTQSENWALYYRVLRSLIESLFQSSPSPKTGRYCTRRTPLIIGALVPILTQSENWALLSSASTNGFTTQSKFQSSPSPKTGRYDIWQFWILASG